MAAAWSPFALVVLLASAELPALIALPTLVAVPCDVSERVDASSTAAARPCAGTMVTTSVDAKNIDISFAAKPFLFANMLYRPLCEPRMPCSRERSLADVRAFRCYLETACMMLWVAGFFKMVRPIQHTVFTFGGVRRARRKSCAADATCALLDRSAACFPAQSSEGAPSSANFCFMVGLPRVSFFTVSASALSFASRSCRSLPSKASFTLVR